jgi:hypothetical protein
MGSLPRSAVTSALWLALAVPAALAGCHGALNPPSATLPPPSCFPGGAIVLEVPAPGSIVTGTSVQVTLASSPAILSGGTYPPTGVVLLGSGAAVAIPSPPASLTGPVPAPASTVSPAPFSSMSPPAYYQSVPIPVTSGQRYTVEIAAANGCVPYPITGAVFSVQ